MNFGLSLRKTTFKRWFFFFGRFESAIAEVEKASLIDHNNLEVARVVNTVKMAARARSRGNDLFGQGKFSEACSAYGEGLNNDSNNYVLFCNRAVCWSKLGLWEKSVEDCNHALLIQPNCTKAILLRAVSNSKVNFFAMCSCLCVYSFSYSLSNQSQVLL